MPTDVAIHEAAHAVVAAYTGRRVRHIIVNPDGTGEVAYYRPTHIVEGEPPFVRDLIMINAAGFLAEGGWLLPDLHWTMLNEVDRFPIQRYHAVILPYFGSPGEDVEAVIKRLVDQTVELVFRNSEAIEEVAELLDTQVHTTGREFYRLLREIGFKRPRHPAYQHIAITALQGVPWLAGKPLQPGGPKPSLAA